MRAPASATASAVCSNWVSDSTAHGPAITTKSLPPISRSRTCTTLREHSSVLATRSKQENCPFHLGFINAAILVMRKLPITNQKQLEHAKATPKDASYSANARPNFFVSTNVEMTCDFNH